MRLWLLSLAVFACVVSNAPLSAQDPFYKEKLVRIIVGTPPGTGLDLFSRTIARHMGKHIPGNPTFMVNNMVGAGSWNTLLHHPWAGAGYGNRL